jgi:hypothetical protein
MRRTTNNVLMIIIVTVILPVSSAFPKAKKDIVWTIDSSLCAESKNEYIVITKLLRTQVDTFMLRGHPLGIAYPRKWYGDSLLFFESGCCERIWWFTYNVKSNRAEYFRNDSISGLNLINISGDIEENFGIDSLYRYLDDRFMHECVNPQTLLWEDRNVLPFIDSLYAGKIPNSKARDTVAIALVTDVNIHKSLFSKLVQLLPILFSLLSVAIAAFALYEAKKKSSIDKANLDYNKKMSKPHLECLRNLIVKPWWSNEDKFLPPFTIMNQGLGYAEVLSMTIEWEGSSIFKDDKNVVFEHKKIDGVEYPLLFQRFPQGYLFSKDSEFIPIKFIDPQKDLSPMINSIINKAVKINLKYKSFYDDNSELKVEPTELLDETS